MVPALLLAVLLSQNAPSAEVLVHYAQQDFQSGNYSEAREKLRRALRTSPRDPALWNYLGLTEAHLNQTDSAIRDFEKVLSLSPANAQAYFNLGLLYAKKGLFEKASEMYRRGLALDADDPAGNQNYALLLMQAGKFRDAVGHLQKLRALQGDALSVRVALIESYMKSGMQSEGEREVREFLDSRGAGPTEQLKLAQVLVEDKLPDEARLVLEHVVRVAPDSAEAHARLGMLFSNKDQFEDAARYLGRAVELAPDSAEYSLRLAEVLLLWHRFPTALEFLMTVKPRFGTLPEFHYKLALAYYGLHLFPQAVAELETLGRDYPQLDRVQHLLADSYMDMGDLAKAEAHYRRAIELNPNKAPLYASFARLLRIKTADSTDEAIQYLEKALALDPGDAQSKLELALCYEKKTKYAQAQSLLEEAIRRDPNMVRAHVALARVYYHLKRKLDGDRERGIVSRLESEEQAQRSKITTSAPSPNP
jgi:tetratricopeptide (TPR) repeat protein